MKKGRFLLIVMVLFAFACSPDSAPSTSKNEGKKMDERKKNSKEMTEEELKAATQQKKIDKYGVDPDKLSFIKVKVVDQSQVAGCNFLLELSHGKRLEPDNLPDKFKSHGKEIWVKYIASQSPSNCNTGKVVELIAATDQNPN